ncbi:helix-turn-helix transcriptional regulator [Catellatospora vulcania]|uniref:helix-turn-helix transcriptional regulator n=1 Tax=Catellatospora vulcania TaxID=1460450 RepID=UPI002E7C459D|nr:LuxR C-terminal-related transcriptional regulator [Catellatospora vulcania]
MQTMLVCVSSPAAASAISAVADRLNVAPAVRTAVTQEEALAWLGEHPADIVLAEVTLARHPDIATFVRKVLALVPYATVIFFGEEEPEAARAAIRAGARGVIGAPGETVATAAKSIILLVLAKAPHSAADRRTPAMAVAAGSTVGARATLIPGPRSIPPREPLAQRMSGQELPGHAPPAVDVLDRARLQEFWRLIEASSLGADGAQQLRELVDPTRSALVASQAGLREGSAAGYLLGEFVQMCQSSLYPERSGSVHIQTLFDLLRQAGRQSEAAELRMLAIAEGFAVEAEPRALRMRPARSVTLTERELQVLRGMADGMSNAEIGAALFVSEDTVKTHVRRLFRKLGARDRAHAVATGFRAGLIF